MARAATPLPPAAALAPRLVLLSEDGSPQREIVVEREEFVVGRTTGNLTFTDDEALSPEHAMITWRNNALRVRDLGSANGSWVFITSPHPLVEGDVLLLGSQIVRYRRLMPPAEAPETLAHVQAGSRVPGRDVAMLEQLRADGSVRDVVFLSPGRTVLVGRDHGDWVFPYDPTMSARHAEVRPAEDDEEFVLRDLGSRNGVAVLVRGEREVRGGERLLLGHNMLRVELA